MDCCTPLSPVETLVIAITIVVASLNLVRVFWGPK